MAKNDFIEGGKVLWAGVRQVKKLVKPTRRLSRASKDALKRAKDLGRQSE